jgi:HSP20 family protein
MPSGGFRPLEKMRKEMEDLFARFAKSDWPPMVWGESGSFVPAMDVKETPEAVEIDLEVPGLKPEEIDISLSGEVLTVKGEKKEQREENKEGYHLLERRFGSFQRSLRLPAAVERDKVQASQKDGVLHLVLPKSQREPVTKIAIKTE